MFRLFEGQTADKAWQKVAAAFRDANGTPDQSSRGGMSKEILHAAISVGDPRQRWVASRQPPMNIAFALAEVVWIMNGRNDSQFLNYFNRELPRYAGDGQTYHGAYGHRLRLNLGIDQLNRAYDALKSKPDSRRVVLQIWDGRIDLPHAGGAETQLDIPCSIVSMLKARDGHLEWTQVIRSNDVFRGLPYNFVQFTTLQEIVAGWLGLELGSYNQISDSLHVYSENLESVRTSLPIDIETNTDSLLFSRKDSEAAFTEMAQQAELIIKDATTADDLQSRTYRSGLPMPFKNILYVLCAEGARRRKCVKVADELIGCCSNPAYRQLFGRWLAACSERAHIRMNSQLPRPLGRMPAAGHDDDDECD
jgi:thymidylate synthase